MPYSSWSFYDSVTSDGQNRVTSRVCRKSLAALFRSHHSTSSSPSDSSGILPVVLESCSHPSGVSSLLAQPYVYGGGGLGNVDECPLQTCLATTGTTTTGTTTSSSSSNNGMPPLASFCVPTACRASDLGSPDFADTLRRYSTTTTASSNNINNNDELLRLALAHEYVTVYERINELNRFLQAGWTCGEWVYDTYTYSNPTIPTTTSMTTTVFLWYLYLAGMGTLLLGAVVGTTTSTSSKTTKTKGSVISSPTDKEEETCVSDDNKPFDYQHQALTTPTATTTMDLEDDDDDDDDDDNDNCNNTETKCLLVTVPKEQKCDVSQIEKDKEEEESTTLLAVSSSEESTKTHNEEASSQKLFSITCLPVVPQVFVQTTTITTSNPVLSLPLEQEQKQRAFGNASYYYHETRKSALSQHEEQQDSEVDEEEDSSSSFWSAFDLHANYHRLLRTEQSSSSSSPLSSSTSPLSSQWHMYQPKDGSCCGCGFSNDSTRRLCFLHGIRVLSLMWIMLGHTAAIASSTGPGFSNPASVLPPHGWAVTWMGQLIFSSRLAVDTFLVLSGFLLVVVASKRHNHHDHSPRRAWYISYVWMILSRIARILPVYLACLGFYVFVAPRYLGGGVFWYQWAALLEPCTQYGWTNLLFVNNFYPFQQSTTNTCFYHSWYLAVDVQLFMVGAAVLMVYQRYSKRVGKYITLFLCVAFILLQVCLTYQRGWSLNTFDGAAVARYDVEAYAKPHVRAPSYLVGMYCAMLLLQNHSPKDHARRSTTTTTAAQQSTCTASSLPSSTRSEWLLLRRRWCSCWTSFSLSSAVQQSLLLLVCLGTMFVVTFATVSGAYARRPCQFQEWPQIHNCGSRWSPMVTFWFTALSRTLWVVAVATFIYQLATCGGGCLCSCHDDCTKKHNNNSSQCGDKIASTTSRQEGGSGRCSSSSSRLIRLLFQFLSLSVWTLPSRLSFAAYLFHPVWLFVWQLGAHQKYAWDGWWFTIQYVAVCVVTLGSSLVLALWVEVPCAQLWKRWSRKLLVEQGKRTKPPEQQRQQNQRQLQNELAPRTKYGAIERV